MLLRHIGLVCSSEENAKRFYGDILGLTRLNTKQAPASLSEALFGLDTELTIINYGAEGVHFEVFIRPEYRNPSARIEHVCLEVAEMQPFVEKCGEQGVDVLRVPKGDGWVTFIADFDGNRFEVKATADA